MKDRFFGIFGRVFFYTVLILILVISVMFIFFADQIKSVVESTQREHISQVFHPFLRQLDGKSKEEIGEVANDFHRRNASFEFFLETLEGQALYKTENFIMPKNDKVLSEPTNTTIKGISLLGNKFHFNNRTDSELSQFITLISEDIRLHVSGTIPSTAVYNKFIGKTFIALLLILMVSILAASIFAYHIAKPIKKIANDTKKMSDLDFVPVPDVRKDEIGQLARDVYKMYEVLKLTIQKLENEIKQKKEMEENQKYFFSAASHELKTPIAATSALLEGMLENVIEASQYPQYLRECLKMMSEQNKLVSEILEIVSLNSNTIVLEKEEIHLKSFISDTLPSYRLIANAKGVSLDLDIQESFCCMVDIKLFEKVFSNVLINAIQNTPEKSKIQIYAQEIKYTVCLCILNTNANIPEEILTKLFDPFFRVDQARNRGSGHSGLGLTIVKKALDIMEIEFSLENIEDGVLFRMDLPRK